MSSLMRLAGLLLLVPLVGGCERRATPPDPQPGTLASLQPGCIANFEAFDQDGDQRVSIEEFAGRPHPNPDPSSRFRLRDSDGDGFLTHTEFCTGWRGGPGPRGWRGPGRRFAPGSRCEAHFEAFDVDADGSLTREELAAWPHAEVDVDSIVVARDLNGDGALSREEFCRPWRAATR